MTIWILFIGFFLLALALVLIPVFRFRPQAPQRDIKSIAVYKAQLEELNADQNNGVLNASEVASARLEIERRLLKIADNQRSPHEATAPTTGTGASAALLAGIVTIVLLLSAGFYLSIGHPAMPDFVLKDQDHSVARRAEKDTASPEKIKEVAELEAHLIDNPTNSMAWRALGQNQSDLRNKPASAKAYQHWYELERDNIDAAVVYAESLIILSEGRVGPAALLVLNRARKLQPRNPGVRHYLALANYQSGNIAEALTGWKGLEAESKPGVPWLRPLRRWIAQAERDLGLPSSAAQAPGPVPGPGPALSAVERAAIKDMSADERSAMIKGMVARLQGKMDENPENIEGWFRLAKAYSVLGQKQDAITALEQALRHAPDNLLPEIQKQLEVLRNSE
ncbi:MAG: c-type cytochrome biogenesis protein CcmI [Alphaproteobacteria bacterium]|nr:MAG: c-type cytochrome biogenesis protein CcmI [Alphaproteobacteria bacterium]